MKVHLKDLIIVREIRQENGSMGTSEPESPRYHKVLYHELFARIGQDLNEKSEADRCLIHFECSINGIHSYYYYFYLWPLFLTYKRQTMVILIQ